MAPNSTRRPENSEIAETSLVLVIDSLDVVLDELAVARARLAEARLRQSHRDSPAHRAAVGEHRTRIDALLDLYLEIRPCPQ
ncbi:MAG: hypothetical protein QOG20_518 [Pseudonocardiales bacterium]|jgi:hypothetical protein|nr:hypothetical protein [Pseudonocardiales bacterium]